MKLFVGLWLLLAVQPAGCVVTPIDGPGHPPRAATVARPKDSSASTSENLPSEIAASHILIQYVGAQQAPPSITRSKAEARKLAEQVRARAVDGEDFAALAAEYSDEPGAAERGGSLGRFQAHAMVKSFADAAFRLKVGQLSNVVETPYGFHVILRTE